MADETNLQNDNEVRDWARETGDEKLADGRKQLDAAKHRFVNQGDSEEVEGETRAALAVLRSAMDWLEDTDLFDEAHAELDAAGAYTRQTFGCWLHREGTSYEQRCPVALAHHRVGLSPAFVVEASECTICGQDPATCLHIAGRVYDGKRCARRITKGRILEVSLVARPARCSNFGYEYLYV